MKFKLIILILLIVSCNSIKKEELPKTKRYENLIGKWEVVDSNFIPFDHISFCKGLELNSIYDFDKYGNLKVFKNDNSIKHCNREQNYWIQGNALIIFEYDISWGNKILKLTSDSLKIKIEQIPSFIIEEHSNKHHTEFLNDPRVKKITENGIIVTMKKVNNGG